MASREPDDHALLPYYLHFESRNSSSESNEEGLTYKGDDDDSFYLIDWIPNDPEVRVLHQSG